MNDLRSEGLKRLSVLIAVAFVDMVGLMIVAPLMPFYALRFQSPEWMVGPLISSFAVAQLISSPIWGRVSDRVGRRPALLIGLAASGLAYIVFGLANTLWLLFASRIVQGLGGGTTGVAQAYVADSMAPEERAKALGWLSAGTSLGVIIGPPLGSFASRFGPEMPGLVAAVLVFVNVLFAYRWLPESRHRSSTGSETPSPPARSVSHTLWEILLHPTRPAPRVIWIYVTGMLALNVQIGVLALYLKDTFGVTERSIGNVFLVFGAVGVVMRTAPVGWVNGKLGEVRTMRLGAVLMTLGLLLMPLPNQLWLYILCLMLVPTGTALLFPASTSLVSQRTERHEQGQMMGAQQTFRGIMSIIGPIGATVAFDKLGHQVPFYAAAAVMVVAWVLAAREPHPQPAPASAAPAGAG